MASILFGSIVAGEASSRVSSGPSRRFALSVVVATDRFRTIRRVADSLGAQTVAGDLELVVVCPSAEALDLPDGRFGDLGSVRLVEHPLLPLGEARGAGIRAAAAPLVVIGETHAFPHPDWAEHLLAAHGKGWAVVMPAVANANPGTALSWSSYLIDYGQWAPDAEPGEINHPPSYHAAAETAVLLRLGRRLGELVEPGSALADTLRNEGHRFFFEPRARIEHLNLAQRGPWLHERFLGGRLLGAARRARWSLPRTLVYVVGVPLIPVVRYLRTRPALERSAVSGSLAPRTRLAVMGACLAWAAGELVGYVAGSGNADAAMLQYELHKARYTVGDSSASAAR